jgi:hypothetical protein
MGHVEQLFRKRSNFASLNISKILKHPILKNNEPEKFKFALKPTDEVLL